MSDGIFWPHLMAVIQKYCMFVHAPVWLPWTLQKWLSESFKSWKADSHLGVQTTLCGLPFLVMEVKTAARVEKFGMNLLHHPTTLVRPDRQPSLLDPGQHLPEMPEMFLPGGTIDDVIQVGRSKTFSSPQQVVHRVLKGDR